MKPDWVVHNVLDNPLSFHTHGLNKYGSLEIEIVLPLYQEEGCAFCNCIGVAIAKGLKVEDGLMVDSLFTDELGCRQPIYFFKTKPIHGEKEVYRAIFPDPNRLFPWEVEGRLSCAAEYKDQITFTEDRVFLIEVADKKSVKRYGTNFGSPFHNFKKKDGWFVRPAHYYLVNGGLISTGPYTLSSVFELRTFVNRLKNLYKVRGVRVVCRPIDYFDPIHKDFKEYKERYFQDDICLDKDRFKET